MSETIRWQWWATHGGAGVSTLSELAPRTRASHAGDRLAGVPVIAVCRTSAAGLLSARAFAIDNGAGPFEVIGLVTVADAPGRLPKGLEQLRRHVSGGYRYAWQLEWVEAWRCGEPPAPHTSPRAVRQVLKQVTARVGLDAAVDDRQDLAC